MTPDQFKQLVDILEGIRNGLIGIYAMLFFMWITRK